MMTDGIPAPEALLARAGFVRALVRDLVRDEHEAQDVEQEVYLATLRQPTALRGPAAAWITVVARRVAQKLYRERTRRNRREQVAARTEDVESAADTAARFELQRLILEFVDQLPETSRSAILLRYLDDVPPREIAERLGLPVATVKTRLQRGLARLRADLDEKHDGDRAAWCVIALPLAAPQAQGPEAVLRGGLITATAGKTLLTIALLLAATLATTAIVFRDGSPSLSTRLPDPSNSLAAGNGSDPSSGQADLAACTDLPPPVDLDRCDRDLDLHGVVVGSDGSPIAGAHLETMTFPWRRIKTASWEREDTAVPGAKTHSAKDGTFSIRLTWGETVTLRVSSPGYTTRQIAYSSAGERVRVVMDEGVELKLAVRYPDGAPCPGVPVLVRELAGEGFVGYPWAKHRGVTNAEGNAVFPKLGADRYVTVQALVAPRILKIWVPKNGTREAELVIPSPRVLTGRVTDAATGLPVRGARVRLAQRPQPSATTDTAGYYRLRASVDGWRPGLIASAPDYAPGQSKLAADGTSDFALKKGATASGRLLGQDGAPVVGARVAAIRLPDRSRLTTSDGDGRFEITRLAPGVAHTLVVMASGHPRTLIDFLPGPAFEFGDLKLGRPGVIEGRVLDEDGAPLPRTAVTLQNAGWSREDRFVAGSFGTTEIRFTDDLGRFRFTDQPDGLHNLSVQPNGETVAGNVAQLDGRTRHAHADLRLERAADYVVRVRDEQGDPMAGVRVSFYLRGDKRVYATTDGHGEARSNIRGTVYSAQAAPTGPQYLMLDRHLFLPGEREAKFVLETGVRIAGRVLLDGKPLPGRLPLELRSGKRSQAAFVANGSFSALVPRDVPVDIKLRSVTGKTIGSDRLVAAELKGVKPGSTDVVIHARRIPTGRSVTVRVVSPAGQPLSGLEVGAEPVLRNTPGSAVTNESGVVKFAGLVAVKTRLTVMLSEDWVSKHRWVAPAKIEIVPVSQQIELRLRETIELHGVAVGFPRGSRIHTNVEKVRIHSARLDANGSFVLLLPRGEPGPYVLGVIWLDRSGVRLFQSDTVTDLRRPVRIEKR